MKPDLHNNEAPDSKLKKAGPVSISLVLHIALFTVIGGVVIIEQTRPKTNFQPAVLGENFDEAVREEPKMDEELPDPGGGTNAEITPDTVQAPEVSSSPDMDAITVDSVTNTMFQLPSVGISNATLGVGSSGSGGGSGGGTGGGVGKGTGKKVSFFGLQSEAEGVGFFLDFSGTMDGPNRTLLIKEFEKSLNGLPDDFPVMVIAWSGPAWDIGQQAVDVNKYWKAKDPSNVDMVADSKQSPPTWIKLSDGNRKMILKKLAGMQQAPGGTDWRSPFRLATKATPFPPVVFFMTDGQFGTKEPFDSDIVKIVKSSGTESVVNVVCFGKPTKEDERSLETLSKKFNGKFVKVN